MTDLRTAAQQALKAMSSFESGTGGLYEGEFSAEISTLRAALAEPVLNPAPGYCKHCKQYTIEEPLPAEPVQEPVAWSHNLIDNIITHRPADIDRHPDRWTPLYAAPPQRKPLTDEVIAELWHKNGGFHHHFARNIERWLKGVA